MKMFSNWFRKVSIFEWVLVGVFVSIVAWLMSFRPIDKSREHHSRETAMRAAEWIHASVEFKKALARAPEDVEELKSWAESENGLRMDPLPLLDSYGNKLRVELIGDILFVRTRGPNGLFEIGEEHIRVDDDQWAVDLKTMSYYHSDSHPARP